jgi:hypothetical protein
MVRRSRTCSLRRVAQASERWGIGGGVEVGGGEEGEREVEEEDGRPRFGLSRPLTCQPSSRRPSSGSTVFFSFLSLCSAVAPRGVGVTLRVPVGYSCREPAVTLTGGPTCAWACGINEWCTCVWGTCRFFFPTPVLSSIYLHRRY